MWGVWDCLILKDWCCTSGCAVGCLGLFDTEGLVLYRTAGCGVGCVGLFDTEGLVLHRGQDVVWGVWDCLILKDLCCTGDRMWCGVCGTV